MLGRNEGHKLHTHARLATIHSLYFSTHDKFTGGGPSSSNSRSNSSNEGNPDFLLAAGAPLGFIIVLSFDWLTASCISRS